MSIPAPNLLALDFDGVLCDGLKEYFQTSWRAYCQLWQLEDRVPPTGWAERFYRLRPVIETGWEMPLVLRAIQLGVSDAEILQDWVAIAQKIGQQEALEPAQLGAAVDGLRDRWIVDDLDSWLAEHCFYPGVIQRLKQTLASPVQVDIISTKETRFIQTLLRQQGVDLTNLRVYGKDTQKPKHQILRELIAESGAGKTVWFIEDRLKTLQGIRKHADLEDVRLFLADWGYNTPLERDAAAQNPHIQLLSLDQFSQSFSTWI